jgi:hypothetical protein
VSGVEFVWFRLELNSVRMPMSEEDEIFLERSFQRTLIVRCPTSSALSVMLISRNWKS